VSPIVDELVNRCPIPTVVVRRSSTTGLPWAFGRALVPLSGSRASRGAQEIGAYLSANIGTHLHQLHIVTDAKHRIGGLLADHAPQPSAVRHIINAAADFATKAGANQTTLVEPGENAGERIVETARDIGADIVILAGTSRTGGGDLFLGHTIHQVLEEIDTTVVVAITPE
jgi:nucleotide-binding universal stress UspA family protein